MGSEMCIRDSPNAEIASYDCGHFGVYVEPLFSEVARDETAFLVQHLTPQRT